MAIRMPRTRRNRPIENSPSKPFCDWAPSVFIGKPYNPRAPLTMPKRPPPKNLSPKKLALNANHPARIHPSGSPIRPKFAVASPGSPCRNTLDIYAYCVSLYA